MIYKRSQFYLLQAHFSHLLSKYHIHFPAMSFAIDMTLRIQSSQARETEGKNLFLRDHYQ